MLNEKQVSEYFQNLDPCLCITLATRCVLRALPYLTKHHTDNPFPYDASLGEEDTDDSSYQLLSRTFEALNCSLYYSYFKDRTDTSLVLSRRTVLHMTTGLPDHITKLETKVVMDMAYLCISATESALMGYPEKAVRIAAKIYKWLYVFYGLTDEFLEDIYTLKSTRIRARGCSTKTAAIFPLGPRELASCALYNDKPTLSTENFIHSLRSLEYSSSHFANWYEDRLNSQPLTVDRSVIVPVNITKEEVNNKHCRLDK